MVVMKSDTAGDRRARVQQPAPVVRRDGMAASPRAGARAYAEGLTRSRGDVGPSILVLQRSHGNRFARQVAAMTNEGNHARTVSVRLSPHPESKAVLGAMAPV